MGICLEIKVRKAYYDVRQLEMGSKGRQVFYPIWILWLNIDGSGSVEFIADRLLLFDKSSDDGIPDDGDIKVQKDN